jgi:YesN/AraC family two-component response regulator
MTMPGMTGTDLTREMLAIRPDLPIILCTGFSELIDVQKAKEIGVRDYIVKPISKKDLANVVRKALDSS